MELAEEESQAQWIADGPLPHRGAADTVLHVTEAISGPSLVSHPWNPRLPHGKGIDELSGARRPWTSRLELNIIDGVSLMRALPPWLARHHNAVDDFYFLQIL